MIPKTDFKNKILCDYIHKEERHSRFDALFENARTIISLKKEVNYTETYQSSHAVYILLAQNIERYKNILELIKCLKSKGAFKILFHSPEETYYEEFFKAKIKTASMYLRKLRPYVLEFTKEWSPERKKADCDMPYIGKYFNKWYLSGEIKRL